MNMKKIFSCGMILLLVFVCFPFTVWAQGSVRVSTGSLSITTGGSANFSVIASNAAGRVDISSSNPAVASVSTGSLFLDNSSGTVTVTGKSAGTAVITVTVTDVSSYDEERLSGSYRVTVTVTDPAPTPTPTPTPTPNPTPNPKPSPVTGGDNRSTNNQLKSLAVENYQVTKVDDTHYTLSVRNSTDKIKIVAVAEDNKATINGAGEVLVKVGDNSYEIVVTAENGSRKTYYLKVNRKEQYTIKDLKDALQEPNISSIAIEKDTILTKDNFIAIRDSKKTIEFVRYSEEKKPLYTLVVDGTKLNHIEEIHSEGKTSFTEVRKFDQLTGYRKGIYFEFSNQNKFPEGVSLKLPVDGEYQEGDKVQIYSYDENANKVELLRRDVKIENETVEIPLQNTSRYFITQAIIGNKEASNSYKIIAIAEFVLLIAITSLTAWSTIRRKKLYQQEVI